MTHSVRVATMRAAGLFVAISSVQALAPTAKRRDIGAFLGGAALTTLAPRPALADVKIDPNSVRTTKGGANEFQPMTLEHLFDGHWCQNCYE